MSGDKLPHAGNWRRDILGPPILVSDTRPFSHQLKVVGPIRLAKPDLQSLNQLTDNIADTSHGRPDNSGGRE